jgi:hypothetical protein
MPTPVNHRRRKIIEKWRGVAAMNGKKTRMLVNVRTIARLNGCTEQHVYGMFFRKKIHGAVIDGHLFFAEDTKIPKGRAGRKMKNLAAGETK